MRRRICEKRRGLVEAPLAATQLAQPGKSFGDCCRMRSRQFAGGGCQLRFGLRPGAAGEADSCVEGAADRKQRADAPARREFLEPLAPLRGSLAIMRALARGNHVATGGPDDGQVSQLAAHDGCHRLVKAELAGGRLTLGDVRQTFERQRADLEVHPVLSATDRVACRCVIARRRRIVIAEQSRLGLAVAQPAVSRVESKPSNSRSARWSQPFETAASPRNAR